MGFVRDCYIYKGIDIGRQAAKPSIKRKPLNTINDDYRKLTYKARKELKGR